MPERSDYTLWRAYVPRWAHAPLSGDGAGRFGGRWNPVGQPTIYAAREMSTAWAEYNQGFVQHPALIAQLKLAKAALADLTDNGVLSRLGVDTAIYSEQWRDLVDRGKTPESYAIRARLIADGFDGVIYPSFMSPGGTCVALWRWNGDGLPSLDVVDPDNRLPRSPASWI
jgi:RES domain-containing protein